MKNNLQVLFPFALCLIFSLFFFLKTVNVLKTDFFNDECRGDQGGERYANEVVM